MFRAAAPLLGSLLFATPLVAQASPTVTGTAAIDARVFSPLTITTNETMTFGTVYRSVAKTIAFTDNSTQARRARFTVRGEGGSAINAVITVPATLTSGANSMTIDDWEARHGSTDADGSGTTISLPTATTNFSFTLTGAAATLQDYFLRIRARVNPGASQAAGTYNGTITVDVNYTGS